MSHHPLDNPLEAIISDSSDEEDSFSSDSGEDNNPSLSDNEEIYRLAEAADDSSIVADDYIKFFRKESQKFLK